MTNDQLGPWAAGPCAHGASFRRTLESTGRFSSKLEQHSFAPPRQIVVDLMEMQLGVVVVGQAD